MVAAVERRLRADVPVVSYLTGGVDSSIVVAWPARSAAQPIPTFTIRIADPRLDETSEASRSRPARRQRADRGRFAAAETCCNVYPELIRAAEGAGDRHVLRAPC